MWFVFHYYDDSYMGVGKRRELARKVTLQFIWFPKMIMAISTLSLHSFECELLVIIGQKLAHYYCVKFCPD